MQKTTDETTEVNSVSQVTRRGIMDYLSVGRSWSGALNEDEFLARLYPLASMPSTDYRHEYSNAQLDIWKHRVVNSDWSDDWVFTDSRFDLLHGPDEHFLAFLAETVHPMVRRDTGDALAMVEEYNQALAVDGWEIHKVREIPGHPVFGYRKLTASAAQDMAEVESVAERLSGRYVAQQIVRLRGAVDKDPAATIGTAKEFLETVCRTILEERGDEIAKNPDLQDLVKRTAKSLQIVPARVAADPKAVASVRGLLTALGTVSQHIAEIRNEFGTGHGKAAGHPFLEGRRARLALGAMSSLAVFLYDCHESQPVT